MVVNFLQKIINLLPSQIWGIFPSKKREEEIKRLREDDLSRINYSLSQIGMSADDVTYVCTEKRPLDMVGFLLSNVMDQMLSKKGLRIPQNKMVIIRPGDVPGFSTVIYTRGKRKNEINLLSLETPLMMGGQHWQAYQGQDGISRTAGALKLKKLFQVVHDDTGANALPIGINPDAFAVSQKSKPLKVGNSGRAMATTTLFNLYGQGQLTVWGSPEAVVQMLGHEEAYDARPYLREPKIIS